MDTAPIFLAYLYFKAKNKRNTHDLSDHDMDESLYEVTFSGEIQQGARPDEVKARIGEMFKADEVTIARLFSGKRIVVKKNLSAEAADKYSIAFTKAGAICDLTVISPPTPAADRAATKPSSSTPAEKGASSSRGRAKITALFSKLSRKNTPR